MTRADERFRALKISKLNHLDTGAAHCLPFRLHLLYTLQMVKAHYSNFRRMINVFNSPIFLFHGKWINYLDDPALFDEADFNLSIKFHLVLYMFLLTSHRWLNEQPQHKAQHLVRWGSHLYVLLLHFLQTTMSSEYSLVKRHINLHTVKVLTILKSTVKILKIRTPEKFAVITLKFEQGGFTVE